MKCVDSSGKVVQTATNDEKGNILFQSIKFKDNEVGTHTYTISEVKGTEENTEYDKMVSTVTVTVTKSDDKLVAKITKIVSANGIDGNLSLRMDKQIQSLITVILNLSQ